MRMMAMSRPTDQRTEPTLPLVAFGARAVLDLLVLAMRWCAVPGRRHRR